MNTNKDIIITREFNAPRKAVWDMWTTPEGMKVWHGPNGYSCPVAKMDVREGGTYHTAMRADNGDTHWSTGTYKEIVPLKKLVCSDHFADENGNILNAQSLGMPGNWPDELTVTVNLEETANGTRMTMKHEGIPAEMREMCAKGWNECFDKMAAHVETKEKLSQVRQ